MDTALEIIMLNTYKTAHLIPNGFRNCCIADITIDVDVAKSKDPMKVFILTQTSECSMRLM
jgi:hypothetical protein